MDHTRVARRGKADDPLPAGVVDMAEERYWRNWLDQHVANLPPSEAADLSDYLKRWRAGAPRRRAEEERAKNPPPGVLYATLRDKMPDDQADTVPDDEPPPEFDQGAYGVEGEVEPTDGTPEPSNAPEGVTAASEGGALAPGEVYQPGSDPTTTAWIHQRAENNAKAVRAREKKEGQKPAFQILWGDTLRDRGKPIPWIWPGWLPEAKLTLMAGTKGVGKTTIGIRVAAHLTQGTTPWSDVRGIPRKVLYWSGEDADEVLVGRAEAVGVDFDYFGVPYARKDGENIRTFDPAVDMIPLIESLEHRPVDLIVIDPLIRILEGQNNKAEDVRRSLDPVAAQAEQHGTSILGIGHFAKASGDRPIIERFLGSGAWVQRARMVWAAVECGDRTIFGKAGSNLTSPRGVMDVEIEETTVTFRSGETGLATRANFGEIDTDTTLDELERQLCAEQEVTEAEQRKRANHEHELTIAGEWIWQAPRDGFCTSQAWADFCEGQMPPWSIKSGQGKGRVIQRQLGLKPAKRGGPGNQVSYLYMPGVDIPS